MVSKTTIGLSVMLWVLPRPGIKGGQRDKIRCCGPHPLERGLHWRGTVFCPSPSVIPTHTPGTYGPSRTTHLCVSLVGHSASYFAGAALRRDGPQGDHRGLPVLHDTTP